MFEMRVETKLSGSARVKQLDALFDVPPQEIDVLRWSGDLSAIDTSDWNVGLIVGPSGSGKSTLLRERFAQSRALDWDAASVIDAFDKSCTMQEIADVCQAVGFNTIPAWRRPFSVLSNGEQFRASLARLLLEARGELVAIDEFTSVVDRQVAQIASHAVQKHVRRSGARIVCASVHYDIIDWLQPDWIVEMPLMRVERRSLQRRPDLRVAIGRVGYHAWRVFAPFHYLTAELNRVAKCFCLFVDERPACFAATLHRPHALTDRIEGLSRIVTLPDWQGLGLAFVLSDALGSAFRGIGKEFHTYPAHPALIRGYDKSSKYALVKKPGKYSRRMGDTTSITGKFGGRPCAVFRYVGDAMQASEARAFLDGTCV